MLRCLFNRDLLVCTYSISIAPMSQFDIQAQLGHQSAQSTQQYAHLGQRAQLRLVAALEPPAPPHVNVRSTSGKGLGGASRTTL